MSGSWFSILRCSRLVLRGTTWLTVSSGTAVGRGLLAGSPWTLVAARLTADGVITPGAIDELVPSVDPPFDDDCVGATDRL